MAMSLEGKRTRSTTKNTIACLVGILFAIVSIEAATTGRQPVRPIAQPTQESGGKPARRIMDPAFQNAGKAPGLEIWRIENFKPVPFPKNDYGKFYTGDSYIVLNTKVKNGKYDWDVHFWLGRETSQDEAGAAAALTVQLDDQFGGAPVQYREVQEHESQLFLSHFKNGVRYAPGGVASGFTHVDRNSFEKRLFHVKGKRNIRVKQVDLTIASMNKGDCFILDVGNDIYVYQGEKSKRVERLKSISAANQIRDQDHGGRAKVTVIDEFSNESEIQNFFAALGGGSKADIPDESAGGDDEQYETNEERIVTLYRVSDASGTLKVEPVSQKPLKQEMLDTNDCFILDTANSNIFVWVGKKCTQKEKTEAMNKAQAFLASKKYPSWTQVQRIVQGGEPTAFQQFFQTWRSASELHSRLIRSVDEKPPTRLEIKSEGAAAEFMPDDGTGDVEIFRVENFELQPVPTETYGKFFGGDSYVIRYNKSNKWIIYIWQGRDSSNDEKAASAIQAINLDNELGGKAIQIRVEQDNEPKHFLHIFKGKLITFLGGHASGFKNLQDHDTYVRGSTRMYRVRGTNQENVRATQISPKATSLSSDDVFIVENDQNGYVWLGKDSDEFERNLVKNFAKILVPGGTPVTTLKEGEEPKDFWDALGGKSTYQSSFDTNIPVMDEPKLYHCTLRSNNKFKLEEIADYSQDDLVEDDVMMLDTGSTVYVWVGKGADDEEKVASFKVAKEYLMKKGRSSVVINVKQGKEPNGFKLLFGAWDNNMWDTVQSYNDIRAKFQ